MTKGAFEKTKQGTKKQENSIRKKVKNVEMLYSTGQQKKLKCC